MSEGEGRGGISDAVGYVQMYTHAYGHALTPTPSIEHRAQSIEHRAYYM